MKIKPTDGQDLKSIAQKVQIEDDARITKTFIGGLLEGSNRSKGGDRVSLDLGRSIAQELSIGQDDPARAEQIAKLKERIAAGNYHPDPKLVAAAFAGEISLEVLTAQYPGDAKKESNTES